METEELLANRKQETSEKYSFLSVLEQASHSLIEKSQYVEAFKYIEQGILLRIKLHCETFNFIQESCNQFLQIVGNCIRSKQFDQAQEILEGLNRVCGYTEQTKYLKKKILVRLAQLCRKREKRSEALLSLKELLSIEQDNSQAHLSISSILCSQQEHQKAIYHAKQARDIILEQIRILEIQKEQQKQSKEQEQTIQNKIQ